MTTDPQPSPVPILAGCSVSVRRRVWLKRKWHSAWRRYHASLWRFAMFICERALAQGRRRRDCCERHRKAIAKAYIAATLEKSHA